MTRIVTSQLTLRPIIEQDADRVAEICNDETLIRFTSRLPFPYTIKDAEEFTRLSPIAWGDGTEYRFAVCENGRLIASAGVTRNADNRFELGYWVAREARGRGVAKEAAGAVCIFARDRLDAQTIEAGYFYDNPASARVLECLGFAPTGKTILTPSLGRKCIVKTIRVAVAAEHLTPVCSIRYFE